MYRPLRSLYSRFRVVKTIANRLYCIFVQITDWDASKMTFLMMCIGDSIFSLKNMFELEQIIYVDEFISRSIKTSDSKLLNSFCLLVKLTSRLLSIKFLYKKLLMNQQPQVLEAIVVVNQSFQRHHQNHHWLKLLFQFE